MLALVAEEIQVESFVQLAAPVAIALFGFVVMWGLMRLVSSRKDAREDQK